MVNSPSTPVVIYLSLLDGLSIGYIYPWVSVGSWRRRGGAVNDKLSLFMRLFSTQFAHIPDK